MPKILVFILLFSFCMVSAHTPSPKNEDDVNLQLLRLDNELSNQRVYIDSKTKSLDSLCVKLQNRRIHDAEWLDDVMKLASGYNLFNIDSAIHYYTIGYNRAEELKLDSLKTAFQIHRASLYPMVGLVMEALQSYEPLDTTKMSNDLKKLYFDKGRQMYSYIGSFYKNYPDLQEFYGQKAIDKQLRLLSLLPNDSKEYRLNLGEYYYIRQDYDKAQHVLEALIRDLDEADNMYARATHFLSDIAKSSDNNYDYEYYLTLSAISDLKSATLEMNSLQQLGQMLFEKGDINRSYNYLQKALESAVSGHATTRMIQTAELLPVIDAAYKAKMGVKQRNIYIIIALMAILLIVLLGSLLYIRHEMKQMALLQNRLQQANEVKDVYLSQFLSLCSIYMEKLNQFSMLTNRKISAGQIDELYKMTKSGKFVEEQSREFYQVFDDAFLNIYPTFVESVNALLRPDQQIILQDGEKLNTDLRILAFMRLGIEDTAKIAQVLNYSVNTIYTYRNKLKNRAKDRTTFEEDIMKISSLN